MLNDRDNQDDSEYHFSDDEASYELETETPKAATPAANKINIGERLSSSKRMLIIVGVFLVLVFVVYKMVMPSSTAPSTEIMATPTATNETPAAAMQQGTPAAPPVASMQQQTPPMPQVAQQTPASAPMTATPPAMQQAQPQLQPQVAVPPPQPTQQPMQVQQPAPVQQPMAQTEPLTPPPAQSPMPVVTQQPVAMQQAVPTMSSGYQLNNQVPGGIDARVAAMSADSQRLIAQLQNDYQQKINDYSVQNKALQAEVQTLNTRVSSMESQMGQLLQALTRQNQANNAANVATPPPPSVDFKSPYNVQAIIPGRAWLKSDNGETITVAEGDNIKDLGRVIKIDPYDGVVQVNTGSRVISLSYGNGS